MAERPGDRGGGIETLSVDADYSCKPYARWWWFSGPIEPDDIRHQLDWLKANGFGGVEIAWVYPLDLTRQGPRWLDKEWTKLVVYTKRYADKIGLGCDFTFGTMWPFGSAFVAEEDAARTFDGISPQRLDQSWETPFEEPGYIINHLSRQALRNYAKKMGAALAPALKGRTSALFCDSWEVSTRRMWSPELWAVFRDRFGYDLTDFQDELDEHPDVRYDYRKLISDTVLQEFYQEFTAICHQLGALSRVQCHGAPTDLLAAYASVDIPESEVLLFNPHFSRIAASAAALAGKPIVSCETFTCIYGFPRRHHKRELIADLKLVADAAIANGVNHIIWHGMPYNPPGGKNQFFATVHVGPDSHFADELPAFNAYLAQVCEWMRKGKTYSKLAVYFPLEDNRLVDVLPPEERIPASLHYWEMRHVVAPNETKGYHPLWVSGAFLKDVRYEDGKLRAAEAEFEALYVDCEWLDAEALDSILRLARQGLPVILKREPKQPGRHKARDYRQRLRALAGLPNVHKKLRETTLQPLLEGDGLPFYWARKASDGLIMFFAHPLTRDLRYPMEYGYGLIEETLERTIGVRLGSRPHKVVLQFKPGQSILLKVSEEGVLPVSIEYCPNDLKPS